MKNPDTAFNFVADRLSRFESVGFLDDLQLSDGLLQGSIGGAAVIACSDMGWLLRYVCSDPDANLHLFQNFGHRTDSGGFVETVLDKRLETIIVYGHSPCGFAKYQAKAVLDQESDWLEVGRRGVLQEMLRVLEESRIGELAANDKLRVRVHGWFYNSESQHLEVFDPVRKSFVEQISRLDCEPRIKFVPDQGLVGER